MWTPIFGHKSSIEFMVQKSKIPEMFYVNPIIGHKSSFGFYSPEELHVHTEI
jgi:hypothetical protein